MNGLRAGMSAPPLMAAARVAAGVTSLTCQEPTFTGSLPNRRSRPEAVLSSTLPSSTRHAPQRPLPAPPNNRAVGQLVIRFGVPEGKSEVSYLSQFRLLNATDIVWLNL
jgi:hypothetical protein